MRWIVCQILWTSQWRYIGKLQTSFVELHRDNYSWHLLLCLLPLTLHAYCDAYWTGDHDDYSSLARISFISTNNQSLCLHEIIKGLLDHLLRPNTYMSLSLLSSHGLFLLPPNSTLLSPALWPFIVITYALLIFAQIMFSTPKWSTLFMIIISSMKKFKILTFGSFMSARVTNLLMLWPKGYRVLDFKIWQSKWNSLRIMYFEEAKMTSMESNASHYKHLLIVPFLY